MEKFVPFLKKSLSDVERNERDFGNMEGLFNYMTFKEFQENNFDRFIFESLAEQNISI